MKVFVYYNLRRKLWSIKALEGPQKGLVIAHEHHVLLHHASGKVSEAGRQRVLRDKRKNVHAGIVGQLLAIGKGNYGYTGLREVTYNPYKYSSFVYVDTLAPYGASNIAYLTNRKVYVA